MRSLRVNRRSVRCVLVIAGLMGLTSPLSAQQFFRAWIGLYESSQLGWLENENRIGQLCPDPSKLADCYAERLGPSIRAFDLYAGPDRSTPRVGDLLVVSTPGRGLSSHFRPAGSTEAPTFRPDLFLQDWGYGPYFHQTLSEQRGDWYQLPAGPWETAVWLHLEADSVSILEVSAGDVLEMRGSAWYVVAAEPWALLVRPEQPGDVWCEEGEPPSIEPTEPTRLTRADLQDSRGHLVFVLKYLKGC